MLKFLIEDATGNIVVNVWEMQAVEGFKIIKEGISVSLSDVHVKFNSYSKQNELNFTKNTVLQIV